jgi:hypothetical protein
MIDCIALGGRESVAVAPVGDKVGGKIYILKEII